MGSRTFSIANINPNGHELVVFDFSSIALSEPFKDSVEWIKGVIVSGSRTTSPH